MQFKKDVVVNQIKMKMSKRGWDHREVVKKLQANSSKNLKKRATANVSKLFGNAMKNIFVKKSKEKDAQIK